MTADLLFQVTNTTALLAWIALIAAPGSPRVRQIVGSAVPLALSSLYAVLIVLFLGAGSGSFASLAGVSALFADPWILLAGWVHYLAFDLLLGVWEVEDAETRGVSRWLLTPCLVLTFLFGPAGWLLYRAVRASARRTAML